FDIRVSGTLEVNDRRCQLNDAPGQQSHLWGTKHADGWVWGHCNAFQEDETAVFEGLSVRVRIGPLLPPPLTLFCLRSGGRLYRLNGPWQLLTNRSTAEVGVWRFAGQGSSIRIEGEARCAVEHLVGAEYTDPDGEKRWCHNAKVGDLRLTVFERAGRDWERVQALTSRGTCAIEWVGQVRDSRVALWI
ncbi:MAG: tocopherol cyclase family protein, partial [Candidatus Binatia bacterium]